MSIKLCKQGIDNLCLGIVNSAVNDYLNSRLNLDLTDMRLHWTSERSNKYNKHHRIYTEACLFFKTELYRSMNTHLTFDDVMRALNIRYNDEFSDMIEKKAKEEKWPESYKQHILGYYELCKNKGELDPLERLS